MKGVHPRIAALESHGHEEDQGDADGLTAARHDGQGSSVHEVRCFFARVLDLGHNALKVYGAPLRVWPEHDAVGPNSEVDLLLGSGCGRGRFEARQSETAWLAAPCAEDVLQPEKCRPEDRLGRIDKGRAG